jgi:hypothetical protein
MKLTNNITDDTCIQILILKLLYAIFTRMNLYEYFYTNDLYVLVDIILREVCGLGDTKEAQTVSISPSSFPLFYLLTMCIVVIRSLFKSIGTLIRKYTIKFKTL